MIQNPTGGQAMGYGNLTKSNPEFEGSYASFHLVELDRIVNFTILEKAKIR